MESHVIPKKDDFLPDLSKRQLLAMQAKEKDPRYRRRYDAALMRRDGCDIGTIADELSVNPLTIMNWLNRMVAYGPQYKVRVGRLPSFTPEQLKELEDDMKHPPSYYGIDAPSWTSKVVSQHVLKRFDIKIPNSSMRRIMTRTNMNWPGSAAAKLERKRAD